MIRGRRSGGGGWWWAWRSGGGRLVTAVAGLAGLAGAVGDTVGTHRQHIDNTATTHSGRLVVADNTLIIKQKSILPVSKTR